jgi:hypothetical protein
MRQGHVEEQIRKASGALVPVLGEGAMGGFTERLPSSHLPSGP